MKPKPMPATCLCGEEVVELDASGYSTTLCCPRCRQGVLVINHPDFRAVIVLEDFCRKRGNQPPQRPLDDHALAEALLDCLVLDVWPSPAAVVDFGIDSTDHLGALQHAVCVGVTAYDLDRVLGDGRAITCLTRSVPGQPYPEIKFATAYDGAAWDFGEASHADRLLALDDADFE